MIKDSCIQITFRILFNTTKIYPSKNQLINLKSDPFDKIITIRYENLKI